MGIMKLLILGAAQSGKDTIAEYLSEKYKMRYLSTSIYIAKHIIMPAFSGRYSDFNACYSDRINNREGWASLINEYCKDDPSRIMKEVLLISDIYCGLRSSDQFSDSFDNELYDLSIWVERPGYTESSNSMTIKKEDADFIIMNDKNLSDLHLKLDRIFEYFDNHFFDSRNVSYI
jgi:hypothetical protein